ncbi:hypothetical protein D3C85_1058120 [compost metagenome]
MEPDTIAKWFRYIPEARHYWQNTNSFGHPVKSSNFDFQHHKQKKNILQLAETPEKTGKNSSEIIVQLVLFSKFGQNIK